MKTLKTLLIGGILFVAIMTHPQGTQNAAVQVSNVAIGVIKSVGESGGDELLGEEGAQSASSARQQRSGGSGK